ncbi:unnamed protein product, partial [Polarella glacialis]
LRNLDFGYRRPCDRSRRRVSLVEEMPDASGEFRRLRAFSRLGRSLRWRFLSSGKVLAVAACALLLRCSLLRRSGDVPGSAAFLAAPPSAAAPSGLGRRDLLSGSLTAAVGASVAGEALVVAPGAARAEQAWQLALPRTWRTFAV